MAGLLGKVTGLMGGGGGGGGSGIDMFIGQGFSMFDKDKSGFIDGPEAKACVERVLGLAGIANVPTSAIDSVFNRVAGPDAKLDKAEFTAMVHELLNKAQGQPVTQPAA